MALKPVDLISRHRSEWDRAVTHPFLEGVRDGSLPIPAFDLWLEQDYLFVSDLLGFQARLLALAPRKAQHPIASGLVGLVSELDWFEAQAQKRELRLQQAPTPITESYRSALDDLLGKGFEPAMTALWALERIYFEAWMGASPGTPEYAPYIEHWTQVEFGQYVQDLEAHAGGGHGAESAFLEICKLEHDFWEMAWRAR
jgi:thiaminase/transcriptional activator TenA